MEPGSPELVEARRVMWVRRPCPQQTHLAGRRRSGRWKRRGSEFDPV